MNQQFVDGVLYIFNNGEDVPWLEQPTWPDLTPWADEAQALAWGQTAIDYALEVEGAEKPKDGPA